MKARTKEEDHLAKFLARRVRAIRMARGLRQKDLEERGLSYKYYQRIEAGAVNLTLSSLEKVASALGIKVFDLFQEPKRKGGGLRRR